MLSEVCPAGGWAGKRSDQLKNRANGFGSTHVTIPASNEIVRLQTTMIVPPKPVAEGTVFLWPGLQPLPGGKNYQPIGNGVLQPVLTWGSTCARGAPNDHRSWWISGHYVNMSTRDEARRGCLGGDGIAVEVGTRLVIDMQREGSVWTQRIFDSSARSSVEYAIDLNDQAQNWAIFHIELPTRTKPAGDLVFANTVITLAAPGSEACQPNTRGADDFFSAPRASPDGLRCCLERIVLRASGVASDTPNELPGVPTG